MDTTKPLEYDRYYHIYNRGINGTNLPSGLRFYLRPMIRKCEAIKEKIQGLILAKVEFCKIYQGTAASVGILPSQNNLKYNKNRYIKNVVFFQFYEWELM